MSLYVDIKKDFGSFKLDTAFEMNSGVMGILGASGCGKSMTLRCIAGIVTPDEGKIELDGTVFFDSEKGINLKPQERRVGLLFQNYALFPNMTVWQNLMCGLKPYERDRKKREDAVREMMDRFYLTGLEKSKPSQLSGGQQQRTALARILLSKPRILMLDEPFSALDEYLRWNLELELKQVLKDFGGSTLFVSHNRDEIYRVCDRVCVMDEGKSSPVIGVKEMFEYPQTKAAAMLSGCKNIDYATRIDEHTVWAKSWGLKLKCEQKVSEEISYVGVRSHFIYPVAEPFLEKEGKRHSVETMENNRFCCDILEIIEDVFSIVIMLRPVESDSKEKFTSSDQNKNQIRVEVTKQFWTDYCDHNDVEKKIWVEITPHDIMLLTK